jgi:hypothetical protein
MSKDQKKDKEQEENKKAKTPEQRMAENTAPPITQEQQEGKKTPQELEKEKTAEKTRRGIILRTKQRDTSLNEEEQEELNKITEEESKKPESK